MSAGLLLLVLIGVVAVGWVARSDARDASAVADASAVPPLPVSWFEPDVVESYSVRRQYVGRVESRQGSAAGFEIGGTVVEVVVDEGDAVDAGQVIARLDTARLDAQRAELDAALRQAEADAELAGLTLSRVERVRQRDAATQREFDEAVSAVASSQAAFARAEAAIASLVVDLEKSTLRAPFDATVAARSIDPGRVVSAGTEAFVLLASDRPRVRVSVSGDAARALPIGKRLDVQINGGNVSGVVTAVLPTRDRVTRGVDVLVTLSATLGGAGDALREGDLARIELEQPVEATGFWVPTSGLTQGVRGLWSVYVLTDVNGATHATSHPGDATVRRMDVELLHAEADRAYVRSAVDPGMRLVAEGLQRLAPGMTVRPNDAAWAERDSLRGGHADEVAS